MFFLEKNWAIPMLSYPQSQPQFRHLNSTPAIYINAREYTEKKVDTTRNVLGAFYETDMRNNKSHETSWPS